MSTAGKWAIGCATAFFLVCIAPCGGWLTFFAVRGREGGVRYANTMEPYAQQYVDSHHLLEPGETLIAYYDDTASLDGTECAILTDRRVLTHSNGVTRAMRLVDIERLSKEDRSFEGTFVHVFGPNEVLEIEIAAGSGAEGFYVALERARDRVAPKPVAPEAEPSTVPDETGDVVDSAVSDALDGPAAPPSNAPPEPTRPRGARRPASR